MTFKLIHGASVHVALILVGLMHGVDRDEVLSPDWEPLQRLRAGHALHPSVDEVASASFRRRSPPKIVGSGYVVKSLEAALWAFHSAEHFREAVLKAVNLGHDADTTGAVCGQLAGACWGVEGFPRNARRAGSTQASRERDAASSWLSPSTPVSTPPEWEAWF